MELKETDGGIVKSMHRKKTEAADACVSAESRLPASKRETRWIIAFVCAVLLSAALTVFLVALIVELRTSGYGSVVWAAAKNAGWMILVVLLLICPVPI